MEEVTPAGMVVATSQRKLEDIKYSVRMPSNVSVNGLSALSTSFSAQLTVVQPEQPLVSLGNVSLTIAIYRFVSSGIIPNGPSNTVSVSRGSIKFSLALTAWPFSSTSNYLRLGIKTEIEGSDADSQQNSMDRDLRDKDDGQKQEKSMLFPGNRGRLDLATSAVADGASRNVTLDIYHEDGDTNVRVTLPYYKSTLVYDPTISGKAATTSSAAHSVPAAFLMLALATVAALLNKQ